MKQSKEKIITLVGNPNTGKSSLFNKLTGMSQKVGNYPGVTVEKKSGKYKNGADTIWVDDLPGTYSINPTSGDEQVVLTYVKNELIKPETDLFVYVAEISNLRRNLLLFSQLKDLGLPMLLVINMADQLEAKGISIDIEGLKKELDAEIILASVKKGQGIDELKRFISGHSREEALPNDLELKSWVESFQTNSTDQLDQLFIRSNTVKRLKFLNDLVDRLVEKAPSKIDNLRKQLDKVFLHRFFGIAVFFVIVLLVFQAVYSWSVYPMEWIDELFANFSGWVKGIMSPGLFRDLIAEGLIPGIGGVAIFIPQIAILFLFIGFLEESGYMSRVVYLTDRVMRRFGLSGKSIIPLISGTACAIPAVMATRNIQNPKEKLITVLVTPFVTCSARLPVYLMMIALVIPSVNYFGVNLQAMVLFSLYALGFVAAFLSAFILSKTLKMEAKDSFVVEMPEYRLPSSKNILIDVFNKTKSFVFDAGKIIVALSVILWFLASHGVGEEFSNAEKIISEQYANQEISDEVLENKVNAFKVEHSLIGQAGKFIEPAIAPLGYDWKIGIAVISSFAAREVFIGSLATIYNVGSEEFSSIKTKMSAETKVDGSKVFNLATGLSILIFYVFAMQCMSTLAIVKTETGSWKWPMIQLLFMSGIAYLLALITYQLFK